MVQLIKSTYLNEDDYYTEAYMTHNVQNLTWYLESLSKEELKDICRNFDIKGFSSKNKDELIELIQSTYFKDDQLLTRLLQELSSDYKLIFYELAVSDDETVRFNRDIPDTLFLFYPEADEHLVIPKDVKQHFKQFIETHPDINSDIQLIEFYHSAFNLYGFVSLKQLAKLQYKYKGLQKDEQTIKEEITRLLPEYKDLIQHRSVKHRDLAQVNLNMKALTHGKKYYEPATESEFLNYKDPYFTEPSEAIEALRTLLDDMVTEEYRGTYTAQLITDTIIFGLRANDTPEFILKHIQQIENSGFLKVENRTLPEYIARAIIDTRLWSLNGHKPQQKKERKVVQVKQKKKKRKKK